MTLETSLETEGRVSRDKRSKFLYEISVINVYIIHLTDDSYLISAKAHGVAFLRDKRHLCLQSSRQRAILIIRATIINAARQFLNDRGFLQFVPPILTTTCCELTSNYYDTEYFNKHAYLTQNGHLYLEDCAMSLGNVYSCTPTFRAEKFTKRRHLTEFW